MVNAEVQTLHAPDGTPVTNVAFDLSDVQVAAASYASAEIVIERHRGQELEVDDVLALRELTGMRDELDRLAEAGGHVSMVLPLARFIALHDAVDEYVATRTQRDWLRKADKDALPVARAMLDPMTTLRARGLSATLTADQPSG